MSVRTTGNRKTTTTTECESLRSAFVACDVTLDDCPIVCVSDNFQSLTGYGNHEVVGHNCRFLQAPDGNVEAGATRQFVDNSAVFNLKKSILERCEIQQSLINYCKGGRPFLNLLTMVPISWHTDEVRYIIGFQIDLVQSPNAVSSADSNALAVDYKQSNPGWTPPTLKPWHFYSRQHCRSDDVSAILHQLFNRDTISEPHALRWPGVLLDTFDGPVHILSPKGLFLYVSSACASIFEYGIGDLLGNSISSICHPSDIVSVNRELKDATVVA